MPYCLVHIITIRHSIVVVSEKGINYLCAKTATTTERARPSETTTHILEPFCFVFSSFLFKKKGRRRQNLIAQKENGLSVSTAAEAAAAVDVVH